MDCTGADRPTCMDIMDRALALERSGDDVIHLEKGELDFDTPEVIKESAIRAIRNNKTRYTNSTGLIELREAICAYYLKTQSLTIDPAQVIVNSGSSPAMLTLFLSVLSPGDEVLLPNPGFASYAKYIQAAGGTPVRVSTVEQGFAYTAEAAKAHLSPATKAVVINFPSNPLGTVMDKSGLADFGRLGPLMVSDEVYQELVFDGLRQHSILETTETAIVVNSFSKAFAMTGWRLGYMILPAHLVGAITPLHQQAFISPNEFVQWAGIAALENASAIHESWRAELHRRRDTMLAGLTGLGFQVPAQPRGAFYVFARLPECGLGSDKFAADLLTQQKVAVTPGPEFGTDGEDYVRFSYAASQERIEEATARMAAFLEQR